MKFSSGIAMPLDFTYWTNRVIIVLSSAAFLAGIGIGISEEIELGGILFTGFITAAPVFMAWALGREVDPEGEISALFAAAGFLLASTFFHPLISSPSCGSC